MNRSRRAAGLFLLLALAGPLRAQTAAKDAAQRTNDWLAERDRKQIEQETELARRMAEHRDAMQKFWLLYEAGQLVRDSDFFTAAAKWEQSVAAFRLQPLAQMPPLDAVRYRDALLDLGRVRAVMGDPDRAAERADQALQVDHQRVHAPTADPVEDELDQVETLIKAANVYAAAERPQRATICLDEALMRCTWTGGSLRGAGRDLLLARLRLLKGSLACADQSTASYEIALPLLQQALDVFVKLYPPASYQDGTQEIACARAALAGALANLGQGPRALQEGQEARRVLAKQFPNGSPDLAGVDEVLAQLHFQDRQEPLALDDVNRARQELERCFPSGQYPDGHPRMIRAKTALAAALDRIGHPDLALRFDEEALKHCQDLYREARADWVDALLNYGQTLQDCGRPDDARRNLELALDMARRLHPADDPAGRPLVARCLLRLGALQGLTGATKDAQETLRQAADLYRAIPDGGPSLSAVACELGRLALRGGDRAAARRAFAEALEADRGQLRNLTRAAAEVEVLTFSEHRRLALAGYLTATRDAPDTDAQTFAAVWAAQGAVTRLAEARRLALRLARDDSPDVRRDQEDLHECCVRLDQLRRGGREPEVIEEFQERRNRLEIRLSEHWPEPPADDAGRGPDALAAALPAGSAFIDFVLYDDAAAGPSYAAFVVAAGGRPRRIDLGPAAPVDERIEAWRKAVAAWSPDAPPATQEAWEARSDQDAAELGSLLWKPLDAYLPAGIGPIYLAADGNLARLPFAALPGDQPGAILLEERTLATVPNGPFLLERLRPAGPAAAAPVDFLALGEVDFDAPGGRPGDPYRPLPYSGEGLRLAERVVAPGHARTLCKGEASLAAVCRDLARARQAHLSTHGYFDHRLWDAEAARLDAYLRHWSPDAGARPAVLGPEKRYPLSYVGLVLAGANGTGDAGRPGVLTGEEIADLRLDGLALVTLGACDTGLGEYTAGEGVEGLQRAFHLAGCPNVVATLWGVRDRATLVLIQEFYHQLWDNHLSSLEALRQAQLTIYHDPDLLTIQGAPRGPLLDAEDAPASVPPAPASPGARRRAAVQNWAAFVHSGVGAVVETPLRAPVSAALRDDAPAGGAWIPWTWAGVGAAVVALLAAAGRRLRRRVPALADPPLMATLVDDPANAPPG